MSAAHAGPVELHDAFYDLPALVSLRDALVRLDPGLPPAALVVWEAAMPRSNPRPAIGILPGSFDPLTNAHGALAAAALAAGGLDAVYFALSRHTVDKEAVARPSQADRVLVLQLYARRRPGHGVLLINRGLYAEQAAAARDAFPAARTVVFIVGFDKVVQIFDPRYYEDRDAALARLFAVAELLVAPRADAGAADLTAVLDQPENRRFASHVRALPLDPAYAADSATAVRAAARAGRSVEGMAPPETLAFLAEARPYEPPRQASGGVIDAYAAREAAIADLTAAYRHSGRLGDLRAAIAARLAVSASTSAAP